MTPERITRLKRSFEEVTSQPRALAGRFYEELFGAAPQLRPLFPKDLSSLQGDFEAALALVIRNLENMAALQESLRDLGAHHVEWGARPSHYPIVRDALLRALASASPAWNTTLEDDWRSAITSIIIPMLQGAAVHTAVFAERLSDEGVV